ncbi:MAG: hypothetical protein ACFFD4_36575 [Candidatus Odinarchaeota archaeon]
MDGNNISTNSKQQLKEQPFGIPVLFLAIPPVLAILYVITSIIGNFLYQVVLIDPDYFVVYYVTILLIGLAGLIGVIFTLISCKKQSLLKQGYIMLIFQVVYPVLILAQVSAFFSGHWEKIIARALDFIDKYYAVPFLIVVVAWASYPIVVGSYKIFHLSKGELTDYDKKKIEIADKSVKFSSSDFSFPTFNQYIKFQLFWLIIPLIVFPLTWDTGITGFDDPFLIAAINSGVAAFFIGSLVGCVHFLDFKKKTVFELYRIGKEKTADNTTRIKLSSDLADFLEVGLVLSLLSNSISIGISLSNQEVFYLLNIFPLLFYYLCLYFFVITAIYPVLLVSFKIYEYLEKISKGNAISHPAFWFFGAAYLFVLLMIYFILPIFIWLLALGIAVALVRISQGMKGNLNQTV